MKRAAAGGARGRGMVFGAALSLALAPVARAQTPPAAPGGFVEPLPVAPAAQPWAEAGHFRLGLRTGYGLPLGRYARVRNFAGFRDDDVNQLSDDTYGVIPVWLDAGYWLTSHFLLGAYAAFGIVLPKQADSSDPLGGGCPRDFDCAATGVRAGVQAEYAFGPYGGTRPWLGVGLGYEWVSTDIEGRTLGLKLHSLHHGFELLQLSGGADVRVASRFALGPFATLSALQYTGCSLEFRGEQTCEIEDASWHGWILLGVRGVLGL